MNKYLSLLLICSAAALYGQNPPEKSMFEKNLESANELYKGLTEDEKAFCDLIPRGLAVQHAIVLRDENKLNLIPAEIGPEEDMGAIDSTAAVAVYKLSIRPDALSEERWRFLANISAIRISAPFKKQADLVGEKSTWHLLGTENFEDPNYLVPSSGNQSSSQS